MGKVTGKDIMRKYEERNSAQSVQSSSASTRKVTGADIMNSYDSTKEKNNAYNHARTIPIRSASEEVSLKQQNQKYATGKIDLRTLAQEKAIEDYNAQMQMYRGLSGLNTADGLVGVGDIQALGYYNDAQRIKQNSGMSEKEFISYADNWNQLKDLQKSKEYDEKTSAVLEGLSPEQKEELDKYNATMQQYKNKNMQNASMGIGVSMEDYENASAVKREFMSKYGVSSEDFDKYAQYVQESQDRKSTASLQKDIQEDIKKNPVGAGVLYTGLDILTSPIAGLLAAGESLKSLGYADKDAPVNSASYLYALQNMGVITEEQVLEEINNPVGDFAYNVGVSTAKSAMGLALGSEPLTLASFGASAYSSALKNAQDKGIPKERAMMSALGAGAAEMAFEKLSLDHLYDLYKSVGKTALKNTVKNVFIQSGIEGSEEVFTELANIITDNVVNGEFSDYGMNIRNYQAQGLTAEDARKQANRDAALQVGESFFAGLISGGVMGSATTAVGKINYHNLGKSINQDADTKSKVIEAAQAMDENTTAKEIVANTKAEEITDEQMAQIIESMAEVDQKNETDVVSQILSIAPVQESNAPASNAPVSNALERVDNTNSGINSVNGIDNNITERNHGVTKATLPGTNEQVIALKFDEVSKDTATVRLGNGAVVPLSEVQMNDNTMQQLYNFASTVHNTKASNVMLDRYAGQPMEVYARACITFYNAGQLKTASFDEMVHNSKNAQLVAGMGDTATLYQMFELGRNSVSNIAPVQQKVTKQKVTEGKVIDNRTDKSESRLLDLYTLVAKRTGVDIELNDTLEHGARGNFTASLGKIALSNRSDNQYEVLVHELMEYASTYNPQKMQEVYDMVLSYAMSDMGAERLTQAIKTYQNAYEQVEHGKTFQSASEEYVHDYLAGIFSTEEGVRDFVDFMTKETVSTDQQRSILQTVADFFRDIAKKIGQYIEEHTLSDVAKMGLRADATQAQQIRQAVLDVLEDTIGSEVDVNNTTVRHSFAGKIAKTADMSALERAEFMEEHGATSEEIRTKTGWHRGYDNKWRFEIDDSKSELVEDPILQTHLDEDDSYHTGKLEDVLKHNELYEAYPELKDLDVVIQKTEPGVRGMSFSDSIVLSLDLFQRYTENYKNYLNGERKIEIERIEQTPEYKAYNRFYEDEELQELEPEVWLEQEKEARDKFFSSELGKRYHDLKWGTYKGIKYELGWSDNAKEVLMHEIQHNIQKLEGFAEGSSEEYWKRKLENGYDSRKRSIKQEERDLLDEYYAIFEKEPEFFGEMERLMRSTPDMPRGAVDWDTLEQIEEDPIEWQRFDAERDELEEKYGREKVFHFMHLYNKKTSIKNNGKRTAGDLYYATAGEIEARETARRVDYSKEQRKQTEPKGKRENLVKDEVVFATKGVKSYDMTIDQDGIENYTTSDKVKSLSYGARKQLLLNYMRKDFLGRTAKFTKNGNVYYAFFDQSGVSKGVYGDNKSSKKGYKAKINIGAEGNYIELAENALYTGTSVEQGKSNKFHNNAKTWDYFVKTIKCDGIYYDVLINVKDTGNDQYVYDITLKEAALLPDSQGSYDGSSTASIDSISQYSENATKKSLDIKLSLDVDLMSILEEEYSKEENESASIIEEGFAALQNANVDKKAMHKLAYKLKKEYKSAYSIDDLTDNLTNVFAYLKDHPDAKYEDMLRIMREVARPVIEESTDVDTWEKAMYDNFREYFKGKTIRLNREQIAEVAHYYGSFENFRRQNFGSINFSAKNGTYLDSIWEELVQQSNFMLDIETYGADQPIALVDTLQALKPVKKNIYGMNTEQASYDLALDIFRQFFVEQAQEKANEKVAKKAVRLVERQQEFRMTVRKEFNEAVARLREYDTEKRDNMRREYQIKLNDAKKSMYTAVKDHDMVSAKKYEEMEKFYQEQIRLLNKETNEKILAIKASNRQNMANRRAYEEQKRVRERIVRNAKGIINYFNTNTDKRHVPEALKTPIAQFITSIDFISEKANPNSAATLAWQDSLNLMYRRLTDKGQASENGYEDVYAALNGENGAGDVLKDMSAFLEQCSGKRVTDLSVRELEWLDGIITALKRAITDINRLYVNKRTQSVAELGTQSIQELLEKKDKKSHAVLVEKGMNVMDANMLDSRSFFDRLGEAAFSIYDELRTAFNERVWLLKEAQDYMTNALEGLDVKKWTGENAQVHDFVINGQHLQMTTAQIMSLYELNKRNQAKLHMTVGGIRPTVIGKGSKQIKRVTAVKLTSRDIDTVCNTLTVEQKAVADKIQKFLADNCAKWGNKASMQMYGYERFGAKNYFPIRTDGNTVDTKDDSKFWFTKNQGFTKETVKNASNPLIVSDIFEVFTKHVTDMASYSTYSAAMMDAMKWYNFRSTDLQGDVVVYDDAVKTQIERVYGNTYLEYFKKLIEDINAENKRGIESEIAELLTSNMKAASVGANLRVAIQQPTAYLRAAAVMDPKYLSKAVFKKSAMKKAKEHSAITLWKSWGYFETSIGRSMQNVLTGQKTWKEKAVDTSMAMAQFMDDFTWGYLWNACEAEISDKHKDVKYDSSEYLELVSKRFDEVVDQTQVVDTVLHKSHIMRSKNLFNKMVTSFMSEPTKSYNLLMNRMRDVYEGKKGAKKVLSRAVNAYVVTQILNAAVVSIVDAFRDWDEDDKTFVEKYLENFKENAVDNTNPLTMIPYAKDLISIVEGYDVNRQDMQGMSTLINGGRKVMKYVTDEEYRGKHTLWEVCKELIKGGSQVYGAPAYNPIRDIEAIWNTLFPDMRIGGRIYSKTEDYNDLLDGLLKNDKEAYDRAYQDLMDKGMKEGDIPGKIISKMKERYENGTLSKEDAEKLMIEELNYDKDDAWFKINREWEYESKYGLLYNNIDYAYNTGNTSDRRAIDTEIKELLKHGVEESDIAAGITRKYKEAFVENPSANMKNLLLTCYMYCGYTRDEAMKKIEKWSE